MSAVMESSDEEYFPQYKEAKVFLAGDMRD